MPRSRSGRTIPESRISFRLSVLLHRDRHNSATGLEFKVKENQLTVMADEQWLDEHPLTAVKLAREAERLTVIDIRLRVKN